MKPNLHFEVLPKSQHTVWKVLQQEAVYLRQKGYYLAGGTGLALQLGHRQSLDFDFFSEQRHTAAALCLWLEKFPGFVLRDKNPDTVHADVQGVKLSFIGAYRYPAVGPFVVADGIRLASVVDIALMKFLAITHRATLRDYIDLAVMVRDCISLPDILKKSEQKYGETFNSMLSLKALISFQDLDADMPLLRDKSLSSSWQKILQEAVKKIL